MLGAINLEHSEVVLKDSAAVPAMRFQPHAFSAAQAYTTQSALGWSSQLFKANFAIS